MTGIDLHGKAGSGWARAGFWGAFLVVLWLGVGPYLPYLHLGPIRDDAVIWIVRSAYFQPDWVEWVFQSPHFSAFRPLAALSYTCNSALAQLDPFAYRVFDLLLHGVVVILLLQAYRRVAPGLPAFGALVAAGLFLAHPGVEEVLPYLARRSYTLASAFGLGAMLSFVRAVDRTARSEDGYWRASLRFMPGGVLLVCALLSNEIAFAALPLLPLIALHCSRGPDRLPVVRTLLVCCTIPFVLAAGAVAARIAATGTLGGYGFETAWGTRYAWAFTQFWRELGCWSDATSLLGKTGATIAYSFIVLYLAWRVFSSARRAPLGLLAVGVIVFPIYAAALGVWFPRMVYAGLIPFSLLVAALLTETLRRVAGGRRFSGAWQLIPQGLLILILCSGSPVRDGVNADRFSAEVEQNALMTALTREVEKLSGPVEVALVLPFRPGERVPTPLTPDPPTPRASRQVTHAPRRWTQALLQDRDIRIQPFLFYLDGAPELPQPKVEFTNGRAFLTLAPGQSYQSGPFEPLQRARGKKRGRVEFPAPGSKARSYHAYLFSQGRGRLVPLTDHERAE